jgi:methionyl-tRNA formyltransferase
MKIIFAGTPTFASVALEALHRAGHEIALVLTQPDRPAGRGLQQQPSEVKRLALGLHLTIAQPSSLRTPDVSASLRDIGADVMVVAAYGLLVPADVLGLPRLGGVNIHASLLPRWRGAAPIQRALLAGDAQTGISIMQMEAGLDTGPVLLQEAVTIASDDTAQKLHDRLAALGARLIVHALNRSFIAKPQDGSKATYAAKIDKREARIEWSENADTIERKVRAFDPIPGAATLLDGAVLKIWRAETALAVDVPPGTIHEASSDGITVACGFGSALKVRELQRAGGKRLPASAFLAGNPLQPGKRLGT